jgi:hypothetical protein
MAPILIVAYEVQDTSDSTIWIYRAYSSNDPGRSSSKLKRDVFVMIGYQEVNPEDNETQYGKVVHFHVANCTAGLGDRSQGIYFKCQSSTDREVDNDYSIVARDNRARLIDEGADEDLIRECEHMVVPEVNIPGLDEDSDSGEDSDSE